MLGCCDLFLFIVIFLEGVDEVEDGEDGHSNRCWDHYNYADDISYPSDHCEMSLPTYFCMHEWRKNERESRTECRSDEGNKRREMFFYGCERRNSCNEDDAETEEVGKNPKQSWPTTS